VLVVVGVISLVNLIGCVILIVLGVSYIFDVGDWIIDIGYIYDAFGCIICLFLGGVVSANGLIG